MLENKKKIKIVTNNEEVSRIATIENNEISFSEKPNLDVTLKIFEDYIEVHKSGEINLMIMHKVGEVCNVKVDINLNGTLFKHNVTIITKEIKINNDEIYLRFKTDDEINIIKYQMEGIKWVLQN